MLRVHCIGENASDPGFRNTVITAVAIDYSSNRVTPVRPTTLCPAVPRMPPGVETGLPIQAPIHGVAEEGPLKILRDEFVLRCRLRAAAPPQSKPLKHSDESCPRDGA